MEQKEQFREAYYLSRTGIPITVCRPILTEQERKRRIEDTQKAMLQIYETWCRQGHPWCESSPQKENNTE